MKYLDEVLTKSKKGKIEVRSIIDSGRFVRYKYLDPNTGKTIENKIKLVLYNGKVCEEYFIIPLKQKNKYLLLKAEKRGERKLWDGEKSIDLFELLDIKK